MSSLRNGDSYLHYEDGSHRWPASTDPDHDRRRQEVDQHMADHRRRLGDSPAKPSVRNVIRSFT